MRLCLVISFHVLLLVVPSSAFNLPRTFISDGVRTLAGVPRTATTTESARSGSEGEEYRSTNRNPVTYPLGDDVKLKRDVAMRLQRYAQITSQRVSEDISYICRELCQVAATCPPDCDGYIQPPWGLRRFFD